MMPYKATECRRMNFNIKVDILYAEEKNRPDSLKMRHLFLYIYNYVKP
ncbi:MAG: hypothetical protein PWQ71_475 [Bacteroidota bacterium]|jgi:hypothetical protein|nr:hypothetical protein [Bacteroidota bacterium]